MGNHCIDCDYCGKDTRGLSGVRGCDTMVKAARCYEYKDKILKGGGDGVTSPTAKSETIRVDIFIAGDVQQAKQVCREFCMTEGACVTVEPVDYIYTGGEEAGVRVGFINYPRFPTDTDTLFDKAGRLADTLMHRLCQHSYSIVGPNGTAWYSRRPAA